MRDSTFDGAKNAPDFWPVLTLDGRTVDRMLVPFLERLGVAGVMMSMHYARTMDRRSLPRLPVFVDSGGFALLARDGRLERCGETWDLVLPATHPDGVEARLQAPSVLAFQSDFDRGATLDAPIPPGLDRAQVRLRMTATLANAAWASEQPRPEGFRLYASVQGDTVADYRRCARTMDRMMVDGLAIGGLVPRVKRDPQQVIAILEGVRAVTDKPLHAFGIGKPQMVDVLRQRGGTSFDSSSPMRAAASGIHWGGETLADASPLERLRAAIENIASLTGAKVPGRDTVSSRTRFAQTA
ncbi:MAG: tRNA-guanine transglycosylase [Sphingobacteriia bacterium]|nr:tRNA-guanine transglycosylase [Sphingobacteriia bacterium]